MILILNQIYHVGFFHLHSNNKKFLDMKVEKNLEAAKKSKAVANTRGFCLTSPTTPIRAKGDIWSTVCASLNPLYALLQLVKFTVWLQYLLSKTSLRGVGGSCVDSYLFPQSTPSPTYLSSHLRNAMTMASAFVGI